jgi:molybdenum cofactor cytidylyltransferase
VIAAVVLAAGGSSRLGQPKQLLEFEGQSLVRRAAQAALDAGCAPVVVVVGPEQEPIAAALQGLEVTLLPNELWRGGIGTSIRAGVEHVRTSDALIILACDQPHVSVSVLLQFVARQQESPHSMVAAAYAGTFGIPALFPRAFFDNLLSLGDNEGAKALLTAEPDKLVLVDFPAGAIDIDTPEDLDVLFS